MLINMNRKEKKYARNYSKIELPSYLKVDEFKEYINSQLPFHNWNRAANKFHWNNYVFFVKVGFDVQISCSSDKAFIFLDDKKIPIKLQDYFHLLFVNKMKKYKITKKWFEDDYLLKSIITIEDINFFSKKNNTNSQKTLGFCDEDINFFSKKTLSFCDEDRIKTDLNKIYRTDMMIKVDDTKYICIEFNNDINDLDLINEKNRILNILYNNNNQDRQIVHFSVFRSKYLYDEKYIDTFIKNIIKIIKEYTDISYERKWCIDSMNKYINNHLLASNLYDAFKNKNEPIIDIDIFSNKIIKWKDEQSKKKYIKKFKDYTIELEKIIKNIDFLENDDNLDFLECDQDNNKRDLIETKIYIKDNYLTYYGLFGFISNLEIKYLQSVQDKDELNTFFLNITTGFIEGIQQRQTQLNSLNDNRISL